MAQRTDAKMKATATALRLFRTQGYAATALSQVYEQSGAPRGSFYYHFPEGKTSLARAVIEVTRAAVLAMIARAGRENGGVEAFVAALVAGFGRDLDTPEGLQGCPIALLGAELSRVSEDVAALARGAFDDWAAAIAAELASRQLDPDHARRLGAFIVATLEGAVLVALTTRSGAAYAAATESLPGLVATSVRGA